MDVHSTRGAVVRRIEATWVTPRTAMAWLIELIGEAART